MNNLEERIKNLEERVERLENQIEKLEGILFDVEKANSLSERVERLEGLVFDTHEQPKKPLDRNYNMFILLMIVGTLISLVLFASLKVAKMEKLEQFNLSKSRIFHHGK